jgi:hypothetical protein
MSRTTSLPVLLVLCVVAAGLATAGTVQPAGDNAPDVGTQIAGETVTVTNTTNYLVPSEPFSRQSYARGNVDVAGAVAFGSDRLHGEYTAIRFDRRFNDRTSAAGKLDAARAAVDTAETRLDRLDDRHAAVVAAYADGSLSRPQFLRQLGRIHVDATQTTEFLQRVRTRVKAADASLPVTLDTRIAALRAELVALPSPVTSRLTDSLNGTAAPVTVYAAGAPEGLVLATAGDDFERQATLRSEYVPDQPNQFAQGEEEPISLAFDRARALYPWVFDNLQSINRIGGFGNSDVYFFDLSHPHGELQSYIHGGSTNVFSEYHQQGPANSPVRLTARNETTTLTLVVNASAETGPMRVAVASGTTDVPADATVRVNGDVVGTTGDDGELWTVRPIDRLRVNATVGDQSVTVTG